MIYPTDPSSNQTPEDNSKSENPSENYDKNMILAWNGFNRIVQNKLNEGKFSFGLKTAEFVKTGFGLECYFKDFNKVVRDAAKEGFSPDDTIKEYMERFNQRADNFAELYDELMKTSLKDELLRYFPPELKYIALRN